METNQLTVDVRQIVKLTGLGKDASTALAAKLGVLVGNKYLVRLDKLEKFLNGDETNAKK